MITDRSPRLQVTVWLVLSFVLTAGVVHAGLEEKLEKGLGSQVSREIEQQIGLIEDPLLNAWVVGVGETLVTVSDRQDVDYSFKILDSEDINAIAVPGGHIYVTKGLLRFIESEDELAVVLGHEIGHIVAKHSNKQIKTQLLASLVLSSFKNRRYSSAVGVARMGGLFAMLKFSRDHEEEADLLGLREAVALGYDTERMLDFFQRLDDKQKRKPSKLETYLMTHPTYKDRMAGIRNQPEMIPSAEAYARTGSSMAERGLFNQARATYERSLALSPDYARAISALAQLPLPKSANVSETAAKGVVDGELPRVGADLGGIAKRADALENTEAALTKKIRAMLSTLSFASAYVNPYDPLQVREFYLAAETIDTASRAVGDLRTLVDNSRIAATQLQQIDEYLSHQSPSVGDVGRVSARHLERAPSAVSEIEDALQMGTEIAKQVSQACSGIDFAVRQFQGTLLVRGPAALPMSGAVETQLRVARNSVRKQITEIRKCIAAEEKARSLALQTMIDIAVNDGPVTVESAAAITARYIGRKPSDLTVGNGGLAGAIVELSSRSAASEEQANIEIDYDSFNILLEMALHDLRRETTAAGAKPPFALSAGKQ